jgi:uncharacterized membrane protein
VALGDELSPWLVGPFVGLLLCIAILPLAAGEWFEKNRNKAIVAAVFGLPVVVYLAVGFGAEGRESIGHTLQRPQARRLATFQASNDRLLHPRAFSELSL